MKVNIFNYKSIKKIFLVLFIGCCIFKVNFINNTFANDLDNKIIAIVNNGIITENELKEALSEISLQKNVDLSILTDKELLNLKVQVLQTLINQKIILQLAKNSNLTITKEEISNSISKVLINNNITLKQLKERLKSFNISFKSYEKNLKEQLLTYKVQRQLLKSQLKVSSQEINQYIKQNLNNNEEILYEVQHILLAVDNDKEKIINEANEIIKEIQEKKLTFTESVKKYSNAFDAKSGGNLDFNLLQDLPTIFQGEVIKLKKGEISKPFDSENNVHIIYLKDIKKNKIFNQVTKLYKVKTIVLEKNPIFTNEDAKAQLERIITEYDNGKTFEELALANSNDINSAQNGGDLGWLNLKMLNIKLQKIIKETPLNTISKPFLTGKKWQIILVAGEKEENTTNELLKEKAQQGIFDRKSKQILKTWLSSLRAQSYIKILEPKLNNILEKSL